MDIQAYIQSGIIESYVLGVATAEESDELLRLSAQYPEIKEAVRSAEEAFEQNALANAITPHNNIKDHLLDSLHHDFTTTSEDIVVAAPVFRIYRWRAVTAAAVILLIISAALNFYLYNNYKRSHDQYIALLTQKNTMQASMDVYKTKFTEVSKTIDLIGNPQMQQVKMAGVPGKESSLATVYWNRQTKEVYLLPNHLPAAPAGKQYQLWAIVNGNPVSAGMLSADTGLCKMTNIPSAQAFAITLEKNGGSPAPTLSNMFVMGKV